MMLQMKNVSFFILLLFFIWLLPLGVFIKPSQEKIACGGQRAVCLCSHTQAKVKSSPIEENGFKSASSSQKEAGASGSAGHYYLAVHHLIQKILDKNTDHNGIRLAYRNPSLRSIEHIPKA